MSESTMTTDNEPLELTAAQPVWAAALEPFAGMSGGNSALPILNAVLVQYLPEDEAPSLTRSDRERQLRLRLPLDRFTATGRGELAIDARKLTQIIKALPAGAEVRLREGKGRVSLTATLGGRRLSQFQLGYHPGADFPLMSAPRPRGAAAGAEGDDTEVAHTLIALPGARLATALAQVAFAMAEQDVRYYLNGVLLEWRASSLFLVATDGHKLGAIACQAEIEGKEGQAIIPRETVKVLQRLAQDAGAEDIRLEIAHRLVYVERPGSQLISKQIDGRYPEWRRVVPSAKPKTQWTLGVEDLSKAIARVKILSNEKYHGGKFETTASDPDRLVVRTVNEAQDEAEDVVPLQEPSAMAVTIGFNLDYVAAVLGACQTETITFNLTDGTAGAKLTPGTVSADEHMDDPEWVLMPMLL